MKRKLTLGALAALALAAPFAQAAEAGDVQIKIGAHVVDPKSDNGTLAGGALKANTNSSIRPTIGLEYFLSPKLGIEVLGALPFKHEVKLNGVKAADVKHLPPTVSLHWHFNPDGKVNPFVGIGVNYTRFFSIDEKGPLAGTRLDLDDSWGLAAHLGLEFALKDRWSMIVDARWADIDTKAKVDGVSVGTVNIDPLVYGFAFAYRF
jgi:outer membrane protein